MKQDGMHDVGRGSCPERSILIDFTKGMLSASQERAVETHLATCGSCIEWLEFAEHANESFIDYLRDYDESLCEETGFFKLQAALEKHGEEVSKRGPAPSADVVSAKSLEVPDVLGSYRLDEQIGRGAMGAVYRARHEKLKSLVAVKILAPRRRDSSEALQQFEQEMEIIGRLGEHENVVRARDAGQIDDHHFLVMDYVDGVDVGRLMRIVGPLKVADACEIVRQAARGLAHAHEHGLIHRDVKPGNMMINRKGKVKILDLGLASYRGCSSNDQGVAGTADYMAPEQWESGAQGRGVDIYGLGCTLFKLLAGYAPFAQSANTKRAKRHSHCHSERPRIDEARRDVPPELSAILSRMIARDLAQRVSSAYEVERSLAPFAAASDLQKLIDNALAAQEDAEEQPLDRTTRDWMTRHWRYGRFTRREAGIGLAAALACGFATWSLWPPDYQLVLAAIPEEVSWEFLRLQNVLHVHATAIAFLSENRAVSGARTIHFSIGRLDDQVTAGLFFARQVETHDGWKTVSFRTVGVDPGRHDVFNLVLREHEASQSPSQTIAWSSQQLAADAVSHQMGRTARCELRLQVNNGVLVDATAVGVRLPNIVAAGSKLASVNAGSIAGVFVKEGAAEFRAI